MAVTQVVLTAQGGFKGDREWIVVNAQGEMQWQGGIPRLALIQPVPDQDGFQLQAPGVASLRLNTAIRGEVCAVKIWNEVSRAFDIFPGWEAGRAASAWFSEFLEQPLRLVKLGAEALQRPTANPLHLITSASLRRLNERLQADGQAPVGLERFRPNVLLESPAEMLAPFAEENIARIAWPESPGGPVMVLTGPCVRCVVVNVDPQDASVAKEPLATVAQMSREQRPDGSPCFGVYGRGQKTGVLRLGDQGCAELRR